MKYGQWSYGIRPAQDTRVNMTGSSLLMQSIMPQSGSSSRATLQCGSTEEEAFRNYRSASNQRFLDMTIDDVSATLVKAQVKCGGASGNNEDYFIHARIVHPNGDEEDINLVSGNSSENPTFNGEGQKWYTFQKRFSAPIRIRYVWFDSRDRSSFGGYTDALEVLLCRPKATQNPNCCNGGTTCQSGHHCNTTTCACEYGSGGGGGSDPGGKKNAAILAIGGALAAGTGLLLLLRKRK